MTLLIMFTKCTNSRTQISLPDVADINFLMHVSYSSCDSENFKWSVCSVVWILWELEQKMCEQPPKKTEKLHILIFGNMSVFIQEQYSLGFDILKTKTLDGPIVTIL